MRAHDIGQQLEAIKTSKDFVSLCYDLTASWAAASLGLEAVDCVLRFMEENRIDFGSPGPLVRYVEKWFGKGYEDRLVQSIRRRPTPHTLWMLNRVVNGTKDPDAQERLISIMKEARLNPLADEAVRQEVDFFLKALIT